MRISPFLLVLIAPLLLSCDDLFQYNPNQLVFGHDERDINFHNIEKILELPEQDTLKFILMGDTQRWYDETEDFVKSANNQPGVSFVIHAGDISDFGLTAEFKWVHEIMTRLKYPYVTAMGNHDKIANGLAAYRKMYGPPDYSFEFSGHKFIFVNTNSREYAFDGTVPDVNWLRGQVADNPGNKDAIVIAHIPPYAADFDPNLEQTYAKILGDDPNVKMSLYGHNHSFSDGEYYNDGVHYFVTTTVGARGYMLVTVWKGGYDVQRVEF
ncbi:metallophosphoesterase family protein [Dyadobacter sandarakinus]|uniref:metallophosphoesterase family protein n=1 Tax=Dyadobacter sandarakinus TaxID=2747268 RepID=UPI001E4114D9|nr:metallophosphoesterase [Dyadobacter sandarakinus]